MKPAVHADLVALVTIATAVYGALALSRAFTLARHERVAALEYLAYIGAAALLVAAIAYTLTRTHDAERRERERQPRASQAQRNASIFTSALLAIAVIIVVLECLAAATVIDWHDALGTSAALALVLSLVWYAASTIPYPAMPRVVTN